MKTVQHKTFLKAITRRDPRFDGVFYFGVKTTHIYCRPVCPAKPKPENIVIFKSGADAERAGYRACLRCHPDMPAGSKFFAGTKNTISTALRLIQKRLPETGLNIPQLAHSLGMTDRHVRRLFDQHLGVSPQKVISSQKLHLAKEMLQRTCTSITDIAYTAGYRSIRRFNEAFKNKYTQSPSSFRKTKPGQSKHGDQHASLLPNT